MRLMHVSSVLLVAAFHAGHALADISVSHLQVERRDHPLGLDAPTPRFSWQSRANAGEHGVMQVAYQLTVRKPGGQLAWDSGRVEEARSIEVSYAGSPLRPETRYDWRIRVWYTDGASAVAESWFETGLSNSDPAGSAWEGADWVGGTDADRVLYAQYLPLYDLGYTLTLTPGSDRAAVVFAANDPRLMDRRRNIYQLENARNGSYFKIELDVSGLVAKAGSAQLKVYRAGYSNADNAARAVQIMAVRRSVIGADTAHAPHRIQIHAEYGELKFRIDGDPNPFEQEQGPQPAGAGISVNLNPARTPGTAAHDVITYGMLCEVGFAMAPGQRASVADLTVANIRPPQNALFRETLADLPYRGIFHRATANPGSGVKVSSRAYQLDGGISGLFVVADPSHNSMPMLRTEFNASQRKVVSARLYATARGIYELYLNGQRVGDDFYSPGLSQYNRTHYYQTYDVTRLLQPGRNALGALLGEGWWSGLLSFGNIWNQFGDRQSLLAKLVLNYDDGTRQVVVTNVRNWKAYSQGPTRYSSLDMGEVYDATREHSVLGWSTAPYDDRVWHTAVVVPLAGTAFMGPVIDMRGQAADFNYDRLQIVAQLSEPARLYRVLQARSVKEVRPHVYVYDLGQNIVGVPRLHIAHGVAGRRIVVRVAEMIYPDLPASGGNVGMIMTENYRAALSEDQYVMKAGAQQFQPRFTSHGFQYLEITGLDTTLPVDAVQAVAISSVQKLTAGYETSNPQVNQLWSNLGWSNVDNFLTIPTDCPQRNERMGWSGDISVFSRTATYLSDAGPFLERHMRAMRDVQLASGKFTDIAPVGGGFGGVLWGSAGITVPWEVYQQYGDTALLREHYAAMSAYLDYLAGTLDARTGLSNDAQLGDWLGPQNQQLGQAYLATAYHAYDLWIMSQVAGVIGKPADADRYARLYRERREFFNHQFVSADGTTLGFIGKTAIAFGPTALEGEFKVSDTQTSYAVGLALGLFDEARLPAARAHLAAAVERENVDDAGVKRPPHSLMTGFIGTAWISKALSDAGRTDLAYQLLLNSSYPSWLYPVQQGATTIWERLNGYTSEAGFGGNNSMNSFNHYSFGAVGQWLMAYSLGIQRDEPGFHHFVLQPEPDPTGRLRWARGHYDSPYGRIESAWRLEEGKLNYAATVPANTSATLYLPVQGPEQLRVNGKALADSADAHLVRLDRGGVVLELGSGQYEFSSRFANSK